MDLFLTEIVQAHHPHHHHHHHRRRPSALASRFLLPPTPTSPRLIATSPSRSLLDSERLLACSGVSLRPRISSPGPAARRRMVVGWLIAHVGFSWLPNPRRRCSWCSPGCPVSPCIVGGGSLCISSSFDFLVHSLSVVFFPKFLIDASLMAQMLFFFLLFLLICFLGFMSPSPNPYWFFGFMDLSEFFLSCGSCNCRPDGRESEGREIPTPEAALFWKRSVGGSGGVNQRQ